MKSEISQVRNFASHRVRFWIAESGWIAIQKPDQVQQTSIRGGIGSGVPESTPAGFCNFPSDPVRIRNTKLGKNRNRTRCHFSISSVISDLLFWPDPGPAILQLWESDSCSDSGYNHRSNRNLRMFLPKKWPHRLQLLPKWKSDFWSGFSQIFDSGSERKTQNPAGVDSGTPVPVPPLVARYGTTWFFCGLPDKF